MFKFILSSKGLELYDYSVEPDMESNIMYLFECIKINRDIQSINKLFVLINQHNELMTNEIVFGDIQLELIENIQNESIYLSICERLKEKLCFEIEDLKCIAKKEISNIFQGDIVTILNQEQIFEITRLFQTFKLKLNLYPELMNEMDIVNKMIQRMTSLDITLNTRVEIREERFIKLQEHILQLGKSIQDIQDDELLTAFTDIFTYFDDLKGDYEFGIAKHNLRSVFMKLSTNRIDNMLVLSIDSVLFEKNVKGTFSVSYDAYMFILNKYYFESLKLPERTKLLICEKYGFTSVSNSNMWKCLNLFIIFYINLLIFLNLRGGLDVNLNNDTQNFKYLTKQRINKISGKIRKLSFTETVKQYLYLAINEHWF